MWPPRKNQQQEGNKVKRTGLMSRMSQLFSPGGSKSKNNNTSSSNVRNKDGLSERDSLDRSPDGKLREKSSERVRPPLVEGRAVRDK